MRKSMRLAGAVVIVALVVAGAALLTYYEVYPGQKVLTLGDDGWTVGPAPTPHILGIAFGFYSGGSDLLQISVSTNDTTNVYLLDATEAANYDIYNGTTLSAAASSLIASHVQETLTLLPPDYPSSFAYWSQLSTQHSGYVSVAKQSLYFVVVLSLANATIVGCPDWSVSGYASLLT